MYHVLLIYFKNIQYYCTEFNIVQKLKGISYLDKFLDKKNQDSSTENLGDMHLTIRPYLHILICLLN